MPALRKAAGRMCGDPLGSATSGSGWNRYCPHIKDRVQVTQLEELEATLIVRVPVERVAWV